MLGFREVDIWSRHHEIHAMRGQINASCLWNACRIMTLGIALIGLGVTMATIGYCQQPPLSGPAYRPFSALLNGSQTARPVLGADGITYRHLSYLGSVVMGIGGVFARDWPLLLLTLMARFCITTSFGVLYVFSAEVFPTVLRNTGVSSSSTCGRIGAIVAPFVADMAKTYVHLPAVVLAVAALAGGLLILVLPETTGHKLPDTLTEAKQLGSDTKNGAVPARPVPTLKTTPPAEQYNNAVFEGDGETGGRDGAK